MTWNVTCPQCGIVRWEDITKSVEYEIIRGAMWRKCTIICRRCKVPEITEENLYYLESHQVAEIEEIKRRGRPRKHRSNADKQREYRNKKSKRYENQPTI